MQQIDKKINREMNVLKDEIKRNDKTIKGFRSINIDLEQKLNYMRMMMAQKPLIGGSPFEYHERQIIRSGWTIENSKLIQIAMEKLFN